MRKLSQNPRVLLNGGDAAEKELKKQPDASTAAQLKPLIAKAFKEHDRDRDEGLDAGESAQWWSHFVSEKAKSDLELFKRIHALVLKTASGMEGELGSAEVKALCQKREASFKKNLAVVERRLRAIQASYRRDKARRDQAAFELFDLPRGDKLELSDLLDVLKNPADRQYDELVRALLGRSDPRLFVLEVSARMAELGASSCARAESGQSEASG